MNTTFANTDSDIKELNLQKLMEEILMVLTEKEREVVIKRFSLDGGSKRTLESIGKSFSVTRERVRQIEKGGKQKLRRIAANTKLKIIHEMAHDLIVANGGLMVLENLVSEIIKNLYHTSQIDLHFVRLAIDIDPDLCKIEKTNVYRPFAVLKAVDLNRLKEIQKNAYKMFKNHSDIMSVEEGYKAYKNLADIKVDFSQDFFKASLEVDCRFKIIIEGIGLKEWRHVHPRSVRDKARIILRRSGKPLHFIEIVNKIQEAGFDSKQCGHQALHNELIREKDIFVLVGRGIYGLKEWGLTHGAVKDVIRHLLEEKGGPMSKQDIMREVMKMRYVKVGTVSLNLQKHFVRVGRAKYDLPERSKKVAK